jgi:hypothetical protein
MLLYRFRRIMACSNPQSLAIFGISETASVRFKLIWYYSLSSPWAYFGGPQLEAIAAERGAGPW